MRNRVYGDEVGAIDDSDTILHHILNFVAPGTSEDSYKILKHFDPREGQERHSTKIMVYDMDTKSKIFKGCKNFKELPQDDYLKRVFIKNDEPPLARKENDRLFTKMKEHRDLEDPENPQNRYYL